MDHGESSVGDFYESIDKMWEVELTQQNIGSPREWYNKANSYWQDQQSSLDGVLGGLPELHVEDIKQSRQFLSLLSLRGGTALDCGAGIGRITKHLLLDFFDVVDVLDQSPKYVQDAQTYIQNERADRFICEGLQNFSPEVSRYKCIWIQWVLSHLTEDDLVAFLIRVKQGLQPNGAIVVKENIKKKGFLVHMDDYSVTRSEALYKKAFREAGLEIIAEEYQRNFPPDIFKVKIFALR